MDLLGKKIRHRREQLGVTSQQLATMANVSQAYISQLENGHRQPSYNSLQAIAHALNTPVDYFLSDDAGTLSGKADSLTKSSNAGEQNYPSSATYTTSKPHTEWVARETLNLTTLVDYAAAIESARKANITPTELLDAVEALKKLKNLRR
jgi:transcriptional regulator with XRE-family HTH domain